MASNFIIALILAAHLDLFDANVIRGPRQRPSDIACLRYQSLHRQLSLDGQYWKWMVASQAATPSSRVTFLDDPDQHIEKPNLVYRILGDPAGDNEFPHMVAIGWSNVKSSRRQTYQYLCGGTLISEHYILTAAHCKFANNHKSRGLKSPAPSVAKLGQKYLNKPSLIIEIADMIPHELYKSPMKYYDIALFRLSVKVEFSLNVIPACLSGDTAERGVATGWGATQSGRLLKTEPTNDLHKTTVDILEPEFCNNALANHNWQYGIAEHQICAGDLEHKGRDTCQGDSGSPLQHRRDGDQLSRVLGVTSFGGRSCGQQPAVYTRVASFLPWIEAVVWPSTAKLNTIPQELIWV